MNKVQEEWNNMRIAYQQRYIHYLKQSENTEQPAFARAEAKGHMTECCYVLIGIFGLTDKQITELEHDYSGLTNDDFNEE